MRHGHGVARCSSRAMHGPRSDQVDSGAWGTCRMPCMLALARGMSCNQFRDPNETRSGNLRPHCRRDAQHTLDLFPKDLVKKRGPLNFFMRLVKSMAKFLRIEKVCSPLLCFHWAVCDAASQRHFSLPCVAVPDLRAVDRAREDPRRRVRQGPELCRHAVSPCLHHMRQHLRVARIGNQVERHNGVPRMV